MARMTTTNNLVQPDDSCCLGNERSDCDKSKDQVIEELQSPRRQVSDLADPGVDGSACAGAAVTGQVRTRKVLRQSEESYRILVDHIHHGIALMDCNHRIVMMNGVAERLFETSSEDCIGQECFRVFRRQDSICPDCPGVQAMQTGALPSASGTAPNQTVKSTFTGFRPSLSLAPTAKRMASRHLSRTSPIANVPKNHFGRARSGWRISFRTPRRAYTPCPWTASSPTFLLRDL